MTLFGNSVFADVIKVRPPDETLLDLEQAFHPMTGVLPRERRGRLETHRHCPIAIKETEFQLKTLPERKLHTQMASWEILPNI